MIKKKTVIKYLNAVQEFCSSRDCKSEICPLCTGQSYPYNCLLYGSQPNRWEIPDMKGGAE